MDELESYEAELFRARAVCSEPLKPIVLRSHGPCRSLEEYHEELGEMMKLLPPASKDFAKLLNRINQVAAAIEERPERIKRGFEPAG